MLVHSTVFINNVPQNIYLIQTCLIFFFYVRENVKPNCASTLMVLVQHSTELPQLSAQSEITPQNNDSLINHACFTI